MTLCLNLGSGTTRKQGGEWVNIDWTARASPDIIHDLNLGLPMYADDSIDEIYARGILMQLDDPVYQLREWWRVLKPYGLLELRLPLVDINLAAACNDPTHKHLWSSRTLEYFVGKGAWWYGFDKGWYQRVCDPVTEGEHRVEMWRKMVS
jgi:predicted SAM-dependent methyltransferase